MRFLASRPDLDRLIRDWRSDGQPEESWIEIQREVARRASRLARRYRLSDLDAEDVVAESLSRVWILLASDGAGRIRNYDRFITTIILNLCRRSIEQSKPVWTRIKAEIVETVRGRRGAKGFALWKVGSESLGGYAAWRGRVVEWTTRYAELQQIRWPLIDHLQRHGDPTKMELPILLSLIFNWVATPSPVNELTSLIFELRGLQETHWQSDEISWDAVGSFDRESDRDLLQAIVQAFQALPRAEAIAFFFHLQPEVSEQVLILISTDGSEDGAIPQLSRRLNLTEGHLHRLIADLPLRDLPIAELLGITGRNNHDAQQKIINIRQRALRQIRKSVEGALDS